MRLAGCFLACSVAFISPAAVQQASAASISHPWRDPFCDLRVRAVPWDDAKDSPAPTLTSDSFSLALSSPLNGSLDAHITFLSDTDAYDALVRNVALTGSRSSATRRTVIVTMPRPVAIRYVYVDSYAIGGGRYVACPADPGVVSIWKSQNHLIWAIGNQPRFAAVVKRVAYAAPQQVIEALDEIAANHPTTLGYCEPEEGGRSSDEARIGMAKKEWNDVRTTQEQFAVELARCALAAKSQFDFNLIAGFAAGSLNTAIAAESHLPDRSLAYETQAAALVVPIASWLAANPAVLAKERSWQSDIVRALAKLTEGLYPIPYDVDPDWQETHVGGLPVGRLRKMPLPVFGKAVFALWVPSRNQLDKYLAAEFAYEIAFGDLTVPLPASSYLAIVIYGPQEQGASSIYGYVFARDAQNHWRPRLVTEPERAAVEHALSDASKEIEP
jgi:hypothetical protein